ncbi:hypothetical protein FGU71_13705 [Erythrobacter insulae]|uniref:Uncharacterized protein n=1 Tax=Erythrobacter insulae TaxID=2584124 RepID=A0A547P7C8_9SPHN|nr:hypothetical protein [Erythrobacter insulae]TRD10045.1 hypothetical protein FGU71_13705 [Erythrobacter insulae]
MSKTNHTHLAQKNGKPERSWRTRWPLFTFAGLVGILTLAYIDGGEEPIRPIVQAVTLPGVATESD